MPFPWHQPAIYRQLRVPTCWKKMQLFECYRKIWAKDQFMPFSNICESYRDTRGYHFWSQNFILKPISGTQGSRFKNQTRNKKRTPTATRAYVLLTLVAKEGSHRTSNEGVPGPQAGRGPCWALLGTAACLGGTHLRLPHLMGLSSDLSKHPFSYRKKLAINT